MSTFLLWPDTYLYCNSTYHLMPNKKAPIFVKGVAKQARKPRSYASSKLQPTAPVTVGGEVESY